MTDARTPDRRADEERFVRQPLQSDDTIRLLSFLPGSSPSNIRCALVHKDFYQVRTLHADHAHAPDVRTVDPPDADYYNGYTALSYCWGDPAPVDDIEVNGCRFPIARNLYDALTDLLRHDLSQCYWIDAICLDQANEREKSTQVGRMWRVYRHASQVVSWLAPSNAQIKSAFAVLDALRCAYEHNLSLNEDPIFAYNSVEGRPQAYETLRELDYFQRIWVIPECLNAPAHSFWFVSGQEKCAYWNLEALFLSLRSRIKLSDDHGGPLEIIYWKRWQTRLKGRPWGPSVLTNLLGLLDRRRLCFDPRDRLFALLALPDIQQWNTSKFVPSYQMSLEQACVMVLVFHDDLLDQTAALEQWPSRDRTETGVESAQVLTHNLAVSTGIDVTSDEFRSWLRSNVHAAGRADTMQLPDGRNIDCSGMTLKRLISPHPPW